MSMPDFDEELGPGGYRSPAVIDYGLGVWRENGMVAMHRNGQLPDRCVRCNARAFGFTIPQVILDRPPAAELAISAVLFGLIGATVVRRGSYFTTIDVGLCDRHRRSLRLPRIAAIALFVLAVPTCLTGVTVERGGVWWILLAAMLALMGGVSRSFATNPLRPPRIDAQGRMWFTGLPAAFVHSLATQPRDE